MAEGGGFEPPRGFLLCRISSAVHSTTLPTFHIRQIYQIKNFIQLIKEPFYIIIY